MIATLVLLPGCQHSDGDPIRYDLAHSLEVAQRDPERLALDLGTGAARPSLLAGWSWNERAADGATFVWSDGPRSAVELFILEPRPLTLVTRAFAHPELDQLGVEVSSADGLLGRLELGDEPAIRELELPADALRSGRNRIELDYSATIDVGAGDSAGRRLAAGWDWIRLVSPGAEGAWQWHDDPEPRARRTGDGRLVLESGLQLAYPLELAPGDSLVLRGVSTRSLEGGAAPTLRAWLTSGDELRLLGEWQGDDLDAHAPLALASFTPATLYLQAAPARDGNAGRIVIGEALVLGARNR